MDTTKLIFFSIAAVICGVSVLTVKNKTRFFLFLMVLFAPSSVGLIFYHFNGIMLMDFPLFALLIIAMSSAKKFRVYAGIPAIGMIAWGLVSSLMAFEPGVAVSELTRFIRAYLAFLCIINFTKAKKDIATVATALLAGFAFQAFVGAYQWRFGPMGLSVLGEKYFAWRAAGTFNHPNHYALYLILILPIVFRLLIYYRPPKRYMTAVYGIIFTLGSAALFGSYGRGSWLGFGGSIILMFLYSLYRRRFHPKKVGILAVLVLAATVAGVHYLPTLQDQFNNKHRIKSAAIRMPLNQVALEVIKERPILGTAPGNYRNHTKIHALKYATREYNAKKLSQIVHNSYLLIAAEYGIPGMILFIIYLIYFFKNGKKSIAIKNPYVYNLALGIMTSYIAALIAFAGGPDYADHQILMVFWILGGFLIALSGVKLTDKKMMARQSTKRPIQNSMAKSSDSTVTTPNYRFS